MFSFCFNNSTHQSLAEALSNVMMKIFLSNPHSYNKFNIISDKALPLCGGGINENFNTLLINTQSLLIKCAVRHIYPSNVKEVYKSDVKQILPEQTLNINLIISFSLRYIFTKSALTVFLEINGTSPRKY
jgi:hypothetical protein